MKIMAARYGWATMHSSSHCIPLLTRYVTNPISQRIDYDWKRTDPSCPLKDILGIPIRDLTFKNAFNSIDNAGRRKVNLFTLRIRIVVYQLLKQTR